MNLAQAILFSFMAALCFRMPKHVGTKVERVIWVIVGIAWTLASISKFTLVATEL